MSVATSTTLLVFLYTLIIAYKLYIVCYWFRAQLKELPILPVCKYICAVLKKNLRTRKVLHKWKF